MNDRADFPGRDLLLDISTAADMVDQLIGELDAAGMDGNGTVLSFALERIEDYEAIKALLVSLSPIPEGMTTGEFQAEVEEFGNALLPLLRHWAESIDTKGQLKLKADRKQ